MDIRQQWNLSWQAKSDEESKYALINLALKKFEKHLEAGDGSFGDSFRFPELMGYCERKFRNIVEFLPETKIKGDGDKTIVKQAAMDSVKRKSNLDRERNKAIRSAINYGLGCLYIAPTQYDKTFKDGEEKVMYYGLGAEVVDFRDIYPAFSANQLHDHTGRNYCPYVFRRRIYHYDTFINKFKGKELWGGKFTGIDDVRPTTFSDAFRGATRPLTRKESTEKEQGQYVVVLEYWNQETDELKMYANNFDVPIYECPQGIPFSHKQLPFHFWYNLKRDDSIYGWSEVELNMPYHQFRERMLNLAIDDATLSMQPAYLVSSGIDFNPEENELQPGAIFTVDGIENGKLRDNIQEFRPGGIPSGAFEIIQKVEDSRIAFTGDDTTSLYANPNQLATQTLSKREALQKVVRALNLEATLETQYYIDLQIASFVCNEFAEPISGEKGKPKYYEVTIDGYQVNQDKDDEDVRNILPVEGKRSKFKLNDKVVDGFNDLEIEIIPANHDAEIKRDQNEKLINLVTTILNVAQSNPELIQQMGMNLSSFIKTVAKNLDVDLKEVFPDAPFVKGKEDVFDKELNAITLGIVPKPKPEEYDLMERYINLINYESSKIYQQFSKKAKDSYQEFKGLILEAYYASNMEEATAPTGQSGQGMPQELSQQGGAAGPLPANLPQAGGGGAVLPAQRI